MGCKKVCVDYEKKKDPSGSSCNCNSYWIHDFSDCSKYVNDNIAHNDSGFKDLYDDTLDLIKHDGLIKSSTHRKIWNLFRKYIGKHDDQDGDKVIKDSDLYQANYNSNEIDVHKIIKKEAINDHYHNIKEYLVNAGYITTRAPLSDDDKKHTYLYPAAVSNDNARSLEERNAGDKIFRNDFVKVVKAINEYSQMCVCVTDCRDHCKCDMDHCSCNY